MKTIKNTLILILTPFLLLKTILFVSVYGNISIFIYSVSNDKTFYWEWFNGFIYGVILITFVVICLYLYITLKNANE